MSIIPFESSKQVYLFHWLIVGPVLLFAGYSRNKEQKETNFSKIIGPLLVAVSLVMVLHHAQALTGEPHSSLSPYINALHILVFTPALLYLAYNKDDLSDNVSQIVYLVALGVMAYHFVMYYKA